MSDTTETSTPAPAPTQEQIRATAIKAWYDATTREKKAEVVKRYPFLSEIFSSGQH